MSCQLPPHSFLYRTRYMHLSKEEVLPWHLENVFLVHVSIYLKGLQFMKLNFLNNKNIVFFLLHTLYSNCGASKDYTHFSAIKGSQEGWSIFTTGIVWSYFFQSYAGALYPSADRFSQNLGVEQWHWEQIHSRISAWEEHLKTPRRGLWASHTLWDQI